MEFALLANSRGGVTTVTIVGVLDLVTSPDATSFRFGQLNRGNHRLLLEMDGVTFLSCAGLSALLAAERRARLDGGWLRLTAADGGVTCRVLELTGTHTVLRTELPSIASPLTGVTTSGPAPLGASAERPRAQA